MKKAHEKQNQILDSLLKRKFSKTPSFKLAIISTPRCGSNMFCDTLKETDLFGWPEEWFHDLYIKAYESVLEKEFNYHDYLAIITNKTTTENGLFSVNFHVNQYISYRKMGIDLMDLNFDKVVYLERADKISQAISFAIARHTGQWTKDQKPENTITESNIHPSNVIKHLLEIMAYEDFYQERLKSYVSHEYRYESFTKSDDDFWDIATQCMVPIPQKYHFSTNMKIQRNELNDLIKSRLLARIGLKI